MRTREFVSNLNRNYSKGQKLQNVKLVKDFCSHRETQGLGRPIGLKEAKDTVDKFGGKTFGKDVLNDLIKNKYLNEIN